MRLTKDRHLHFLFGAEEGLGSVKLRSILSQSTIKLNSRRRKTIASTIHRLGIREDELRRAYPDATISNIG